MNNEKSGTPSKGFIIGGVSLATAFIIMCLSILSVILYASTNDTMSLAKRAAKATENYYEADLIGNEFVFTTAGSLKSGGSVEALKNEAMISCSTDAFFLFKEIFVSNEQKLCLSLKYKDGKLTVIDWVLCDSEKWTADDDLGLWDGEIG